MRVTSEFFVAQLVRRLFAAGAFAAVLRRGAMEAGAVFVVARGRAGTITLFGPAPQTIASAGGERSFLAETAASEEELTRRFEREARFDPDFWIVEIETDAPGDFLALASKA